jgi:hypothetical protein
MVKYLPHMHVQNYKNNNVKTRKFYEAVEHFIVY